MEHNCSLAEAIGILLAMKKIKAKSKLICDYFYRNGLLSKRLWELDEAYGAYLVQTEPLTINGYHLWALHYVAEMEKKQLRGKFILPLPSY